MTTSQGGALEIQAAQREDNAIIQERFRRVEGDMESLSMQLDRVYEDLERIQANSATSSSAQYSALQDAIDAMRTRIAELEAARDRDREEIVARLSEKIATLVSAQAPAPRAQAAVSDTGYEHVVQPGENLGKIAQAYGVGISAIVQANALEDPNDLKAGQKLFIPD